MRQLLARCLQEDSSLCAGGGGGEVQGGVAPRTRALGQPTSLAAAGLAPSVHVSFAWVPI